MSDQTWLKAYNTNCTTNHMILFYYRTDVPDITPFFSLCPTHFYFANIFVLLCVSKCLT